MKKLFLFTILIYSITSKAQNYYNFSKINGTYSDLTAATPLVTGNWDDFYVAIKTPFAFKLYSTSFVDSFYIDDFGAISTASGNDEEITFIGDDLNSRGAGKSDVSYKVDGTAPNRIFKLEFKNASLDASGPAFTDSLNIQVWLYETSNIIEFIYGKSGVVGTDWSDLGPWVAMVNPANFAKYIFIEGDPSNPTVNTTNIFNAKSLTGFPQNGTIYRFTPAQFPSGINNSVVRFNVNRNRISIPSDLLVKKIEILNMNGQILQSVENAGSIDLSQLAHGLYIISIYTEEGILNNKLIL